MMNILYSHPVDYAAGKLADFKSRALEKAVDIGDKLSEKPGAYERLRTAASYTALSAYIETKALRDTARDIIKTATTNPKWRNFLISRGLITTISSTVGLFTGHQIALSEDASFLDYIRHALPAAGPSFGTRLLLEPIGALLIFSANKEYTADKFIKKYFKMQSPFYLADMILSPLTLASLRYAGISDNWSVYLNGKVTAPFSFLGNALVYKRFFIEDTKRFFKNGWHYVK